MVDKTQLEKTSSQVSFLVNMCNKGLMTPIALITTVIILTRSKKIDKKQFFDLVDNIWMSIGDNSPS